jgi:hypothetical protein
VQQSNGAALAASTCLPAGCEWKIAFTQAGKNSYAAARRLDTFANVTAPTFRTTGRDKKTAIPTFLT